MKREYPLVLLYLKKLDPGAMAEVKFHPTRRWRFDFCLPSRMLAIEINGGVFTGGRHSGGVGQLNDFEKLNHAQLLGYTVLQFSPQQLMKPEFISMVEACCKRPLNV